MSRPRRTSRSRIERPVRPARTRRAAASRRRKPRCPGCLAVLVVLAVVVGAASASRVTKGVDSWSRTVRRPRGLPGPRQGRGHVRGRPRATRVADDGARASRTPAWSPRREAFVERRRGRRRRDRHPGRHLPAQEGDDGRRRASTILVDPENLAAGHGHRSPRDCGSSTSIDMLAKNTDFSKQQFQKALDDTDGAGPARLRRGQPRGLPVPGDLRLRPRRRPRRRCCAPWSTVGAGGRRRRPRGGRRRARLHTPRADDGGEPGRGRGEPARSDCGKVARVIYNRLENPGTAGTIGLLQIDATVNYALEQRRSASRLDPGGARAIDSPYNTYRARAGLPPGPIEAPGRRGDRRGRQPDRGRLVLLRHRQPADRRDQVRRDLRRVPAATRTSCDAYCDDRPTPAERR